MVLYALGPVAKNGYGLRVRRRAAGLRVFPGRPVSLDPFCRLKIGTLGCISDTAKKSGYDRQPQLPMLGGTTQTLARCRKKPLTRRQGAPDHERAFLQ